MEYFEKVFTILWLGCVCVVFPAIHLVHHKKFLPLMLGFFLFLVEVCGGTRITTLQLSVTHHSNALSLSFLSFSRYKLQSQLTASNQAHFSITAP